MARLQKVAPCEPGVLLVSLTAWQTLDPCRQAGLQSWRPSSVIMPYLIRQLDNVGGGQLDLGGDLGQALVGALGHGGLQRGGVVYGAQHALVARPLALHKAHVCSAGRSGQRLRSCA